jgi:uncharacterized protein
MDSGAATPFTTLSVSECWARLRQQTVGRLAVVVDGAPQIFPVNHVVDHGSLVFRTADGTKLRAAVGGHPVAYEVDGFDRDTGEAWSVMAQGSAVEIRDLYRALEAMELAIHPWQAGPKPRYVRIEPDEVTGRAFRVVAG